MLSLTCPKLNWILKAADDQYLPTPGSISNKKRTCLTELL